MENIIDPEKTALVLIDLQKDIVERYDPEKRVVKKAAQMVQGARGAGIPVIFVKVVRRYDYADVVNLVTDIVLRGESPPAREVVWLREGTEGAELDEDLKPAPEDYIVVKRRVSAFYNTPLETYLRTLGVDTLLVGGIATNWGVESTVRDARDRDLNTIVLSDCCAGMTQEAHDYPLRNIFPTTSRVMTSEEALALIVKGRQR